MENEYDDFDKFYADYYVFQKKYDEERTKLIKELDNNLNKLKMYESIIRLMDKMRVH
jgi:hypothetical protein